MPLRVRIALGLAVAVGAGAGAGVLAAGEQPAPPRAPARESGRAHHFDVRPIARGLNRPTWVGAAPGDTGVWALEQPGRVVRVVRGRPRTMLDLRARVGVGAEQGLLSLAFHPDHAANHLLYLSWTDRRGDSRVAEFRVRGGRIDPRPTRELLHVDQPEENHNGGHLAFGPDGRLHLGLGDGGGAFDPRRTAQDPHRRLGKILATPVDGRARWGVVAAGLRNPWRFSFDAALGELWVADVGQDDVEEINRVLLEPDEPPKNLGWSVYEGTRRLRDADELGPGELVWPVAIYGHDAGCSVTGGPLYGGTRLAQLTRRYVFGDFCSGALWSLRPTPEGGAADVRREQAAVPQLTHIGTDGDGELLFASASGTLYAAAPAGSAG